MDGEEIELEQRKSTRGDNNEQQSVDINTIASITVTAELDSASPRAEDSVSPRTGAKRKSKTKEKRVKKESQDGNDTTSVTSTNAFSVGRKTSSYNVITNINQVSTNLPTSATLTSITATAKRAASVSHKYGAMGTASRSGVISQDLLAKRALSTRAMDSARLASMSTLPDRIATLRGNAKKTTKYVDHTAQPDLAPDPTQPNLPLRKFDADAKKDTLKIRLPGSRDTQVFVLPDFTAVDLFYSVVSKLNITQYDLLWLSKSPMPGRNSSNSADSQNTDWLAPNATLANQGISFGPQAPPIYLIVRWYKTYFKLADDIATTFLFSQISHMIVNEVWPVTDKLAIRLGAIHVHLNYGDFIRAKHVPGFFKAEDLSQFIPLSLINRLDLKYIETRIFSFHRKLVGLSTPDAHRLYLQIARETKFWGVSIYSSQKLTIGVAEDGLFIPSDSTNSSTTTVSTTTTSATTSTSPSSIGQKLTEMEWIPFSEVRKIDLAEDSEGDKKGSKIIKIEYVLNKKNLTADLQFSKKSDLYNCLQDIVGYYFILHQQSTERIRKQTLPEDLGAPPILPDFMSLMRPKIRVGEDAEVKSMLKIFKQEILQGCTSIGIKPPDRLMLQLENRIDNEEVLDIFDMRNQSLNDQILGVLTTALQSAQTQNKKDRSIIEDLAIFYLILSGNLISDGATLGKFITLSLCAKADISHNRLGSVGAQALASELRDNATLEELTISENGIGASGLQDLANSLSHVASQIKILSLSTNNLDAQCGQYLASLVKAHPKIEAIDISENPQFSDAGLVSLLDSLMNNNCFLEFLNVTSTGIGINGISKLIDYCNNTNALNKLEAFRLGYGKIKKENFIVQLIKTIIEHNRIAFLDMRFCEVGKDGTKEIFNALSSNTSILELIMSGNSTHEKGIKLLSNTISSSKSLERLGLRYCSIGKAGFIELSHALMTNSTILWLDLAHNSLDSADACRKFADALNHTRPLNKTNTASLTGLVELNLASCLIGYKEMEELAEGISKNTSLQILHLDGNNLGAKGMRALSAALKYNFTLKVITIQECSVDTEDAIAFMIKVGDECSLDLLDCKKNKVYPTEEFVKARQRYNKFKVLISQE